MKNLYGDILLANKDRIFFVAEFWCCLSYLIWTKGGDPLAKRYTEQDLKSAFASGCRCGARKSSRSARRRTTRARRRYY